MRSTSREALKLTASTSSFLCFKKIGREYFFYYHVLIPGIPLIAICVANFVVWKKQKSPFRDQNHIKREVKLAKTLALLTGISLFTWLPFQILNILFILKVTENFHPFPLTLFISNFCSLAIHL